MIVRPSPFSRSASPSRLQSGVLSLKRKALVIALAFLSFSTLSTTRLWASWDVVAAQVEQDTESGLRQAQETLAGIEEERKTFLAERATLSAEVRAQEAELDALTKKFESLRAEEQRLSEELAAETEEVKVLEGAVRSTAKDAEASFRSDPISVEVPARLELVGQLAAAGRFPGLDDIRKFVDFYFDEMQRSGTTEVRQGNFIGPEGREQSGDILRVGPFSAYYRLGGKVGFLRYEEKGNRLVAVPVRPSWSERGSIEDWFEGHGETLPVDLSGGAIFSRLTRSGGLIDWLKSGGPLVWPILLVGFLALGLTLERAYSLFRIRVRTDEVMDRLKSMAVKGKWQESRDYCSSFERYPTCRVLLAGLKNLGSSRDALENILQERILKELSRLERFLPTISVLAAIAPLLGLLGTVTGMINTFQVITVYGTGDPRMMSGGISEALVTTQLGLAIAVPIVLLHHFLQRRVDRITGDMEEKGTALVATLLKTGAVERKVIRHAA